MPLTAELPTVPSLADLALYGIRAEALRNVPDSIKSAQLAAAYDWFLARVAKRVTRPVIAIDDAEVTKAICLRASIECLRWARGMKPDAGQDALVKQGLDAIDDYAEKVRLGHIVPNWADSTAIDDMSMRLARNEIGSDGFTKIYPNPLRPWWMWP